MKKRRTYKGYKKLNNAYMARKHHAALMTRILCQLWGIQSQLCVLERKYTEAACFLR
jgi:hypothetical protein